MSILDRAKQAERELPPAEVPVFGPRSDPPSESLRQTMIRLGMARTEDFVPYDPCPRCRGQDYWLSVLGSWNCRRCNPPRKGVWESCEAIRAKHRRQSPRIDGKPVDFQRNAR
jgi:hypothetical protein